jgi:hypothetical protein
MAVEPQMSIERRATVLDGMKISWGGVFCGVLAGVGTLMLLSSLGVAVGISALNTRAPHHSAIGVGAAVWAGLTLLAALFVGGWASTRLSLLWERTTAVFEGAMVWVLSTILIVYLAAHGIALVANGTLDVLSMADQESGQITDELPGGGVQAAPDTSLAPDDAAMAAAQAKPKLSATAWSTFGSLVLSLLAAICGAAVGRRGVVGRRPAAG